MRYIRDKIYLFLREKNFNFDIIKIIYIYFLFLWEKILNFDMKKNISRLFETIPIFSKNLLYLMVGTYFHFIGRISILF